jgi:hypothetical protein
MRAQEPSLGYPGDHGPRFRPDARVLAAGILAAYGGDQIAAARVLLGAAAILDEVVAEIGEDVG